MNAYTAVCSHVVFPLHERLKGHRSTAWRRELERSQWWSADALRAHQAERLRSFLLDVGTRVPYYRELFRRAGFDARSVTSAADLRALPLLRKADIRAHFEQMKARGHGPLKTYNTGGSSGQPLVFLMGRDRISHDVAAKWRATRWWDVDIGDAEMVVWGSPIELGAQDRLRRVRDAILRSELLPAFEMSPEKLDGFIAAIQRKRPRMLFGYPSALAHIARHAQRRGQAVNTLGIRVVFVTSERLYDDQRALIAEVFGCPVANGYGGRDAGFIAHECPAGGMHVSAEDIVVELIGPDGLPVADGLPGEIVVTHLATQEFPFLRYCTGDIAVADTRACACGRGLPLLKEIQGRQTDFVVAADGTVMHGLALIYILRDMAGLESFKIVQETLARTTVLLQAGADFDRRRAAEVVERFQRRLGGSVQVDVRFVNQIDAEASGKFRYVVSHVAAAGARP